MSDNCSAIKGMHQLRRASKVQLACATSAQLTCGLPGLPQPAIQIAESSIISLCNMRSMLRNPRAASTHSRPRAHVPTKHQPPICTPLHQVPGLWLYLQPTLATHHGTCVPNATAPTHHCSVRLPYCAAASANSTWHNTNRHYACTACAQKMTRTAPQVCLTAYNLQLDMYNNW